MDYDWGFLRKYDFKLENISNEYICDLCKKILVDPRSGSCGCTYCKICIENHMKKFENICSCLEVITLKDIDKKLIIKLSKLVLNCPIDSCTFSDQLININNHLTVCSELAIKCSFSENGCDFISLSGANVDKHCGMSKDKHLELVLSRMKNDKIMFNIKENELNQKYENEIKYRNDILKYLTEFLERNTEFVWKFEKVSETMVEGENRKWLNSDEFYIFQNNKNISMTLILGKCMTLYDLSLDISHRNVSLNPLCPFNFDVTMQYFDATTQSFVKIHHQKNYLNNNNNNYFTKKLTESQLREMAHEDCLTVKCFVEISL